MRATISSVQQFWISKSCYEFHQLLDPQLVLQVILCSNATYVPAMYTWIFEQWRRWPSFAAASALDFLECSAYIGFDMFSLQFCCILIILCARISMQFSHLFYFHFEKKKKTIQIRIIFNVIKIVVHISLHAFFLLFFILEMQ